MRPTSTTGISEARRGRGFTLLEILVVLVIVAVMSSLVVTTVTGQDRAENLGTEARRLARLTELAVDEAMLTGEIWGLETREGAYRFLRFDHEDDAWVPVDEGPHATRDLPEDADLRLIEPEPVERVDYRRVGSVEIVRPDILILGTGEVTPFELRLEARWDPGLAFRITGTPAGRVTVERAERDAFL